MSCIKMKSLQKFCFSTKICFNILILWISVGIFDNVGTVPAILHENSGPGVSASSPEALYALPLTREDASSSSSGRSSKTKPDWDVWDNLEPAGQNSVLNKYCKVGLSLDRVICSGLNSVEDIPENPRLFSAIRSGIFSRIANDSNIRLEDLQRKFPNLQNLTIVHSPKVTEKFLLEMSLSVGSVGGNKINNSAVGESTPNVINTWPSVKLLNLSRNELKSDSIPSALMTFFPNLTELDLAGNNISTMSSLSSQDWNRLTIIDLSENPLDCTAPEMEIVESPTLTLKNEELTRCDTPSHVNKPKPILQVIHLIKKVKAECRLNCTCKIDYIWEKDKVVYSKTSVNCSNRNFMDFPDPDKLPHPTDTLYLNDNQITSLTKFAGDIRYVNVKNLYLDNNHISSIEALESSDWVYTFQILSLQNNNLTEVPIHLLENILRQNKWIYQIDLSGNDWTCECRTLSTFKVWLLRHVSFVKNIENVRCGKTGQEIRYLRNEDWCKREEVSQIIELLDCVSIFLALLILLVITKVIYDYWKLKKYGKIPWIVSKM